MYRLDQETPDDIWDVEYLYDLSFAPGREALSSYRLRDGVPPVSELCLVARDREGSLGGAIRYWPIAIGKNRAPALLLGPVAVHPTHQGEGLGGLLIRDSLERAQALGWTRVILVGDEPYYSRFGFARADFLEFPPPTNPDRLLYRALTSDAFAGVSGLIRNDCSPEAAALSITAFTSARLCLRSICLTGPTDAGRIDRLRRPIAAKHSASSGRPASSPQKLTGVPNFAHRSEIWRMNIKKLIFSVS
jgi:predicted N-acetyltransferase YhbS